MFARSNISHAYAPPLSSAVSLQRVRMRHTIHTIAVLCLLAGALLACSPSASQKMARPEDLPRLYDLKTRVTLLYKTERAKDWRSWYQMTTIALRKEATFDEFTKEVEKQSSGDYRIISWRILDITRKTLPSDRPEIQAAAAVKMEVVTSPFREHGQRNIEATDYWFLINDEWYWTWRGFPYD
jgi:hypothetical protein